MSSLPRFDPVAARIVETEVGITPTRREASDRGGLPQDVLQDAARRLGVLCLISAAVWSVNLLLLKLMHEVPGTVAGDRVASYWTWRPAYDLIMTTNVFGSLGLFWFTRRASQRLNLILDLALVYEIQTALSVGILNYAELRPSEGVSWIAITILIFAVIVPSTPRKTFAIALIAASMDPLGALIWKTSGQRVPEIGDVLLFAFPNYICAVMAPVVSHIITRLGHKVQQAREMGSYLLGEMIARGGMGEVWQATHRLLVRPAAIKLIKPDSLGASTPEQAKVMVQRFRREARVAAALHSPHTIQLYDFGVTRDGTFYYVMELLDGLDLQRLVTQFGPLSPARTIHILLQACDSLGEAHDRGLVHRDIKPANIQICRRGRECDFVKVLDFGLVKRFTAHDPAETGLTAPNVVAGTPAYLSPEAATGEPVDNRSDIYSLGCVAYWMLTGRQVFQAESVLQMIGRHLQAMPDPPSRYSPEPVPSLLEEIVLSCLAKRPADRPGSVWELADRLAECQAATSWTREDARRWWETRLTPEPAVTFD